MNKTVDQVKAILREKKKLTYFRPLVRMMEQKKLRPKYVCGLFFLDYSEEVKRELVSRDLEYKEGELENLIGDWDAVEAELEGTGNGTGTITGDLSAECPHCNLGDAFMSSGEHAEHGGDTVICPRCDQAFRIKW